MSSIPGNSKKRKGGAEKERIKKAKALAADASKCRKINILFPTVSAEKNQNTAQKKYICQDSHPKEECTESGVVVVKENLEKTNYGTTSTSKVPVSGFHNCFR